MSISENLTLTEIATILDLTPARISQLTSQGVLTRTERGMYSADSITGYARHMRGLVQGAGLVAGQLTASRDALTRERIAIVKLNRAQLEGSLILAKDIEPVMLHMFSIFRSRLLAMPSKMAVRVAGKPLPEAQRILREEITGALGEFARMSATIVPAPARSDGTVTPDLPAKYPGEQSATPTEQPATESEAVT